MRFVARDRRPVVGCAVTGRRPSRLRFGAIVAVVCGIIQGAPGETSQAGDNYAFLVAVADYDRKELKPLQFTRNDILELHRVLVDIGYPKDNIVLMHDDLKQLSNRRLFPESAKIRDELKLLLAGVDKNDSLIVAFSGHGVQFKGEKQNYFCPADARLDNRGTLIAVTEIYKALEKCPARQKLLLVDACRDDPQSPLSKARQSVDLESVTRPQTEAVPEGLVALFSCAAGQRSFEDPDLKHGIFFYHVLQALKGSADGAGQEVTLDDVVSFTRKKTQTFARTNLAAIQTPQQLGDFTGTWVLRGGNVKPAPPPKQPPTELKVGALVAGTEAGQEWDGNGLQMKFRWCPPGSFMMGSPADEKDRSPDEDQVQVTLTGFWLGKHEVTQGEWKTVMGTTIEQQARKGTLQDDLYGVSSKHPMYYVSHDDATEFCRKLTQQDRAAGRLPAGWEYRLPTEAQWEYGCRAGTTKSFVSGDDPSGVEPYAWFHGTAGTSTHVVGTKKANPWGLCDMHGNVWEWCRDWYAPKLPGGRDPEVSQEASKRVIRGGGFTDSGDGARSATRTRMFERSLPGDRNPTSGFRVSVVRVNDTANAADFVVITAASADIKDGDKVLVRAGKAERFQVQEVQGEWYRIDFNADGRKQTGWVHVSQMRLAKMVTRDGGRTWAEQAVNEDSAGRTARLGMLTVGEKAGEEWDGDSLEMKFCWCPPGSFTMGSPKGEPGRDTDEDQVQVALKGFWMGKHEVTQAEWTAVMETTVTEQRAKILEDYRESLFGKESKASKVEELRKTLDEAHPLAGTGPRHPMYFVGRHEAMEFCRKWTQREREAKRLPDGWEFRLPTEAQWEYACRAGSTTATAFGDRLDGTQSNFRALLPYNDAVKRQTLGKTAPVGSFAANAWGLHDMHGNVWEWCSNWFGRDEKLPGSQDPNVADEITTIRRLSVDPPLPSARNAVERKDAIQTGVQATCRGGGWDSDGKLCRTAYRNHQNEADRHEVLGFRVALARTENLVEEDED